jgi:hypothetical protein
MLMEMLRSSEWYVADDGSAYIHRAWMRRSVLPSAFSDRPVVLVGRDLDQE